MPPTIEELTSRYQSTCEKIQDSIRVIEAFLTGKESFTFNGSEEISTGGDEYSFERKFVD